MEYTGWSTLDGVHWMEYTGWSTLDGVHWMEYTGWSTLDGVHWMEYTGYRQVKTHISSDEGINILDDQGGE